MKKPQALKPRRPQTLARESLAQVLGGSDGKTVVRLSYSEIEWKNSQSKTGGDKWDTAL